jgi:hypothetical protein
VTALWQVSMDGGMVVYTNISCRVSVLGISTDCVMNILYRTVAVVICVIMMWKIARRGEFLGVCVCVCWKGSSSNNNNILIILQMTQKAAIVLYTVYYRTRCKKCRDFTVA